MWAPLVRRGVATRRAASPEGAHRRSAPIKARLAIRAVFSACCIRAIRRNRRSPTTLATCTTDHRRRRQPIHTDVSQLTTQFPKDFNARCFFKPLFFLSSFFLFLCGAENKPTAIYYKPNRKSIRRPFTPSISSFVVHF